MPGSYVSFESALAHHGWIPEAVFVTAGVTPGRKTLRFETTDFGTFSFHPLAIADYQFLAGVDRVQMGKLIAFVAQPLRARSEARRVGQECVRTCRSRGSP